MLTRSIVANHSVWITISINWFTDEGDTLRPSICDERLTGSYSETYFESNNRKFPNCIRARELCFWSTVRYILKAYVCDLLLVAQVLIKHNCTKIESFTLRDHVGNENFECLCMCVLWRVFQRGEFQKIFMISFESISDPLPMVSISWPGMSELPIPPRSVGDDGSAEGVQVRG